MFKMFKECNFIQKFLVVLAFTSMGAAFIVPTVMFLVQTFA